MQPKFFLFSFLFSFQVFAFIGGGQGGLQQAVVKLGTGDFLFKKCTATFISPQHILTAAHCFGHDPKAIFSFNETYPDPFAEKVDLLQKDGSQKSHQIVVKKVHFYTQAFYRNDHKKVPGQSLEEKFGHMVEVGDFAIIELRDPFKEIDRFPKLLIDQPNQDHIWVGGFGWKFSKEENRDFNQAAYTGQLAQFGQLRNAFYFADDPTFKKESQVSIELKYIKNNFSYLAQGDSGGGVFRQVGTETFVVGVNHGSHIQWAKDLKIDPATGKVINKPKIYGDLIGFAHIFSKSNTNLTKWIQKILPSSSYHLTPGATP